MLAADPATGGLEGGCVAGAAVAVGDDGVAEAGLSQGGAVGQEGTVDGLLGAVDGAGEGQLVGADGDVGVEDDGPVRVGLGEATGGLLSHPAGHEHVHPQGQMGSVDLEGAGGEEGYGAVRLEALDLSVGHLLGVEEGHGDLLSRSIVAHGADNQTAFRIPFSIGGGEPG